MPRAWGNRGGTIGRQDLTIASVDGGKERLQATEEGRIMKNDDRKR